MTSSGFAQMQAAACMIDRRERNPCAQLLLPAHTLVHDAEREWGGPDMKHVLFTSSKAASKPLGLWTVY